ncbi:nuclear factor NF-kappa-B p105 subunit [Coregonus clupeaformis]|uniref:nuclear factor NF-kappa-B p105 subunit n=1 Tax=Coregonus clupeaformis TaxID=59861 RepID=UPI001BE08F3A|nr:nuclear factor NF-kappa-B p105 subunit [Coregonus clupeaformis]XP_041709192.1 nuclear factor NF-kappa-B p105 subunit [Coregonus clupeaformis]
MAEEDAYLAHPQYFDIEPLWDPLNFPPMSLTNSLRTADGPYLQIIEQPKQRGFRFRYGCEGPSHGGLPGASSEKNRKSYPQVKICNYQGLARVVVQLVTNSKDAHLHAHSLVGKQCDKGICIADLQPKDSSISFPNLGILHVTKKNVSKTLEDRMTEAYRMGYNCGIVIHSDIDSFQGEVRIPRELTDHQRNMICSAAHQQAKEMDLSVVRLMFTAFLPDSDGGFSRRLDPVISDPIFDSKAPNASNLKIVRMDRTAGCVTGGEEVYLLCDKVQKDDIQVRFYEDDETGLTWEAFGDFSPTDVHRQFAIVFKTPKYRDLNLQKPTSVFVQLKRKSDNETSEPKPFTYHPQIIDKEEVQRKRQKTLPNFQDYSGQGGAGGMYRGPGGGGSATGGGPGSGGGGYFQGYSTYNNYGTGYSAGFSPGMSGGGAGIKHAPQGRAEDSDDDSDVDDDPSSGAVVAVQAQSEDASAGETSEERGAGVELGPGDRTGECVLEAKLVDVAERQAEALFQYAVTGDVRYLLAPQRHLMTAQDENGDTGLHLGVIHSQTDAVRSLAQVLSVLPGEEVLNMRNDLYQTPLHLAVITQQKVAAEALLLAGADVTLSDRHGNTALHLATQQKEGGMVECLLRHREVVELVDLPNAAGFCSLHLAVLANNLCSLRDLLVSGGSVEVQERSCGRTALHLATELDNVSLAGCLLLEGNADVDCCTYNGSSPLHIAAGRGSVKLTALLMAAGANPHKENFEPLFFREDDCCVDEEEEEEQDEGYIPGMTPLNMAATPEVLEILNGKEYKPETTIPVFIPPQGDMQSLGSDTKQALCQALECQGGSWESLAHTLGLGILNSAFRLSPSPASTLLDSYEVSGGRVKDLLEGLRTVGNCTALTVLQGALCETEQAPQSTTELLGRVQDLKLDGREDSGVCDSGVELSTV